MSVSVTWDSSALQVFHMMHKEGVWNTLYPKKSNGNHSKKFFTENLKRILNLHSWFENVSRLEKNCPNYDFPPPFLSNPMCPLYPQSMAAQETVYPYRIRKKLQRRSQFFVRVLALQLFMTLAYRNVLLFTLQSVFCWYYETLKVGHIYESPYFC